VKIFKEAPRGQKVFVYYNLRSHVWSVKALTGPNKGLVIAHAEYVTLKDAVPRVSEAGRQRVLKEKQKNVHAGIVGQWVPYEPPASHSLAISYNPYKGPTFEFRSNGDTYSGSQWVFMSGRNVTV
jgi:hypothetical protein